MFDWNDLKHLLAVARTGSTLGAARMLKVNQSTVARRVAALEAALGVPLFERRPDGYRLTARGRDTVAQAERVEAETAGLAAMTHAWRRTVSGTVRVTMTETMATSVVLPALAAIREEQPGLRIEVVADDRRLDLRSVADVALRTGVAPDEPSLVRRRLPDTVWAVYCSRTYAERRGLPDTIAALNDHLIVGADAALAQVPGLAWLEQVAPHAEIACRCNSVPNLIAAVRAGLGVSALPCLVGGPAPDLVRCLPPLRELNSAFWLVYHESRRHMPHIRAFVDAIAAHIETLRPVLEGRDGPPTSPV